VAIAARKSASSQVPSAVRPLKTLNVTTRTPATLAPATRAYPRRRAKRAAYAWGRRHSSRNSGCSA
jgi:hypothetical protein